MRVVHDTIHDSPEMGIREDEFVARGVIILNQQRLVEQVIRERRRVRLVNALDRWAKESR